MRISSRWIARFASRSCDAQKPAFVMIAESSVCSGRKECVKISSWNLLEVAWQRRESD